MSSARLARSPVAAPASPARWSVVASSRHTANRSRRTHAIERRTRNDTLGARQIFFLCRLRVKIKFYRAWLKVSYQRNRRISLLNSHLRRKCPICPVCPSISPTLYTHTLLFIFYFFLTPYTPFLFFLFFFSPSFQITTVLYEFDRTHRPLPCRIRTYVVFLIGHLIGHDRPHRTLHREN